MTKFKKGQEIDIKGVKANISQVATTKKGKVKYRVNIDGQETGWIKEKKLIKLTLKTIFSWLWQRLLIKLKTKKGKAAKVIEIINEIKNI